MYTCMPCICRCPLDGYKVVIRVTTTRDPASWVSVWLKDLDCRKHYFIEHRHLGSRILYSYTFLTRKLEILSLGESHVFLASPSWTIVVRGPDLAHWFLRAIQHRHVGLFALGSPSALTLPGENGGWRGSWTPWPSEFTAQQPGRSARHK